MDADTDVEEVAMVTTAEGRGFPEGVRDLRPPLCPSVCVVVLLLLLLFFLFFGSDMALAPSADRLSLEPDKVEETS